MSCNQNDLDSEWSEVVTRRQICQFNFSGIRYLSFRLRKPPKYIKLFLFILFLKYREVTVIVNGPETNLCSGAIGSLQGF